VKSRNIRIVTINHSMYICNNDYLDCISRLLTITSNNNYDNKIIADMLRLNKVCENVAL